MKKLKSIMLTTFAFLLLSIAVIPFNKNASADQLYLVYVYQRVIYSPTDPNILYLDSPADLQCATDPEYYDFIGTEYRTIQGFKCPL